MSQDSFYHFTTLELLLLLFLGSVHKHCITERDATASPLPLLLSRPFFCSYQPSPAQMGFYFQYFFSAQTFPNRERLSKASNPKDQSCREVKIGAKMEENWAKQASSQKEPYSVSGKRRGKTTSCVWGQERQEGQAAQWSGMPLFQGRQGRMFLHVLGAWSHLESLVATFSSYQSTALPFPPELHFIPIQIH